MAEQADLSLVKELARFLDKADNLNEIEYDTGSVRVKLVKKSTMPTMPMMPQMNYVVEGNQEKAPKVEAISAPSKEILGEVIKSPMVGVIYSSPEAGAEPYIKVGDKVNADQTLFLIEAMKTFNPVKATKSGIVKQILVNDKDPVEFDQPLLILE